MPRRSKGARLWLRPVRRDASGKLTHESAWFILDGARQIGTRLGVKATSREKESALADYLTQKHTTEVTVGRRDPSQIEIDDVLAKYVRDKDISYETELRVKALSAFWSGMKLSEVSGDTCRGYAKTRTKGAARRELEDFRAAINHHRREGLHDRIVSVVLPPKSRPRERYLTRKEAAHLILTTWRYREQQNFRATDRRTRKHIARFMIVARYMGSRASIICGASIEAKRPKGTPWVDLTSGVFYGLPEGQGETRKRRQTVRVPLPLLAHIRRWHAAGQRYVVEWNGKPVKRINKAHAAAVHGAGLGPEVTPHTWRHTVATWLMQSGADPFKAAGFLAMSYETLMRVYGHHHPDHSADVHRTMRKRAA